MLRGKRNIAKERQPKRASNNVLGKKNYTKVKDLPKKELKAKREAVKSCVQKHRLSAKQLLDTSECSTLLSCSSMSSSTPEPPPFLVAMKFLKWGESSKKRKRRSDDRFYKKTPQSWREGRRLWKKQCNTTSASAPDEKEKNKKRTLTIWHLVNQ